MGKWTPNFTDDVLHAKISNLVSGSIRRAAVETEPSITYENFVDDLDTGDSFTASLVDILVKELADRRTHPHATDRGLIADRTIRSLRLLANNSRSFPSRPGRPNSRHTTEYFTASPNEQEINEEDDEFEVAMENTATIEGTRVNTDLHDAFALWGQPSSRRATESPPVPDEWPLPLVIRSPSSSPRPLPPNHSLSRASASNLTRQSSIRRQRSRMVDFNEYAHRRRSTARDAYNNARADSFESVTEPREAPVATVRRFFPFPRARRNMSTANPTWVSDRHTATQDSDESSSLQYYIDPTSGGWFPQHLLPTTLRVSPEAETREDAETLLRAPRLRHGGVRAPESILSRHASPIPMPPLMASTSSEHATSQAPASPRRSEGMFTSANDEAVGYPTPGSTDNDNLT